MALGAAGSAYADYVYTYTGDPYQYFTTGPGGTNQYSSGQFETFTFITDVALPANAAFPSGPLDQFVLPAGVQLVSWTASDGIHSFSGSNAFPLLGGIETDASGAIVGWSFEAEANTGVWSTNVDSCFLSSLPSCISSVVPPPGVATIDFVQSIPAGGTFYAAATSEPGSWQVHAVPETPTLWLMLTGMAMAGGHAALRARARLSLPRKR
jgi:hypothetical protein